MKDYKRKVNKKLSREQWDNKLKKILSVPTVRTTRISMKTYLLELEGELIEHTR